jgi:molybdate transport system substrate-binding protein
MMRRTWIGGAVAGLLGLLVSGTAPARADGVAVFAAASLKNALDEVAAAWQAETGRTAVISYAASSALAKQIESGAPAALFISADQDWMNYVAARNLIVPDSRHDLLGNAIVLIAPQDSTVALDIAPGFDLAGALGDGRLAMADTASVPAGKYGRTALEHLGVWAAVEPKVAQAENVRAALLLVSRGEAPLGIVYRTDAVADPAVKILGTFPEASHPPIVYPIALVSGGDTADARALLDYIRSAAACPLFEKQGFTVLP